MKILFDQGTPVPLRRCLQEHEVSTAAEMGWSQLNNGDLLAAAKTQSFEVLVTTDQNLRYQQNLKDRQMAVVVLMTTSWPRIAQQAEKVAREIGAVGLGEYLEIEI
jgi:predicted nuclease of predicted toxin-antitoxin system